MQKYFLAFGLTLVTGMAAAEENASNPLAAVNNVDLRWQYGRQNWKDEVGLMA